MLRHYLKITLRSLLKNKIFVFINIFGLGISLACCIVAFLNWNYNTQFDGKHIHADEIYRINFVRITNGRPVKNGSCPLPLGSQIGETSSQVDEIARVYPTGGNFKLNTDIFRTSVAGVDPEFFNLFSFDFIYGTAQAIKDRRTILINQELVEKYFRDTPNPVGEILTYIDGDIKIEYKVGGVFKDQDQNSSFYGNEAYVHYDNIFEFYDWKPNDWSLFNSTFVRIKDPAQKQLVESQLQEYVAIQNKLKEDYKVDRFYLDPFKGMAVRTERQDVWNHWFNQSLPSSAAIAPGIMALLILLIACFNFTNTSIAISSQRIKEIGVRKVLGAYKKQLVFQFLGENILLSFFALIFAIILSIYLVPQYSAMWAFLDISFNPFKDTLLIGFLILLLVATAIIAGAYPAFYVSNFQPSSIFRGDQKSGGTNWLTRILLSLQFTVSLIAIICGFVFLKNAEYQKEYDMGFDIDATIYSYIKDEAGFRTMRNGLLEHDKIIALAGSKHSVTSSWYTDPIKVDSKELDVDIMDIGSNYLEAIGATITAGRDFIENSQTDVERSVIINEELANTLGWNEPIGQRIVLRDTFELFVVGVVKDIFTDGGLWDPLQPLLMRYVLPEDYRVITVRTDIADIEEVKTLMENRWKEIFPDELPSVRLMVDQIVQSVEVNKNIKIMFLFLGIIAVLLSAIGLYSLVSLNLNKRQKEIGIRKILGASLHHIIQKISTEFMLILIFASILGSIGGYFMAELLMESIWAYHVSIGWQILLLSIGILFVISLITIGRKIYKAASEIPAKYINKG